MRNFKAEYDWSESWTLQDCGQICLDYPEGPDNFGYTADVAKLAAKVTLSFAYNSGKNTYDITASSAGDATVDADGSIPSGSIIHSGGSCTGNHALDAANGALAQIDFTGAVKAVVPDLLHSIPASGQLTPDIRYDFSLGDSGLTFPGNQGIAIGITGGVTHKGTMYPGKQPPALPVPPPPPRGGKHLRLYVSDYEIDALHWANFKAGLLDRTLTPGHMPNPDVLKVKTWVDSLPSLKPYKPWNMTAHLTPQDYPRTTFQKVWNFTTAVMASLRARLPENIYQQASPLEGDIFADPEELEADLTSRLIPVQYHSTITTSAEAMGMLVAQDLRFRIVIEDGANKPDIVFTLKRSDFLHNLALARSKTDSTKQCMTYGFARHTYAATFVSSTVPKFEGESFGLGFWVPVGEAKYVETLQAMGKDGVPLPIMKNFSFRFQPAQLRVQSGYVEIETDVEFLTRRHRPATGTVPTGEDRPEGADADDGPAADAGADTAARRGELMPV